MCANLVLGVVAPQTANFRVTTQEFCVMGGYTDDLEKPHNFQNRGVALAQDNTVYTYILRVSFEGQNFRRAMLNCITETFHELNFHSKSFHEIILRYICCILITSLKGQLIIQSSFRIRRLGYEAS